MAFRGFRTALGHLIRQDVQVRAGCEVQDEVFEVQEPPGDPANGMAPMGKKFQMTPGNDGGRAHVRTRQQAAVVDLDDPPVQPER